MIRHLDHQTVEVDIHNMCRAEAKVYLERFLSQAGSEIKEVVVIHGYSSGTVLRDMVRNRLKHHRIKGRALSLNPGVTTLFLF